MTAPLLVLDKPRGLTPLDQIQLFIREHPEYGDVKIGYAGRLDPMADGLMLYLVGDENKRRSQYLGLDKEYVMEILFGIATDSYDVLGIVTEAHSPAVLNEHAVKNVCRGFVGTYNQQYPPYSAKTVDGKSLYYWARRGDIAKVASAERTIDSCECEGIFQKTKSELHNEIIERIGAVKGDFRQSEIQEHWQTFFSSTEQKSWTLATVRVLCSSGTYMRTLAVDIGKKLGFPACAYSIRRTRIGPYSKVTI